MGQLTLSEARNGPGAYFERLSAGSREAAGVLQALADDPRLGGSRTLYSFKALEDLAITGPLIPALFNIISGGDALTMAMLLKATKVAPTAGGLSAGLRNLADRVLTEPNEVGSLDFPELWKRVGAFDPALGMGPFQPAFRTGGMTRVYQQISQPVKPEPSSNGPTPPQLPRARQQQLAAAGMTA